MVIDVGFSRVGLSYTLSRHRTTISVSALQSRQSRFLPIFSVRCLLTTVSHRTRYSESQDAFMTTVRLGHVLCHKIIVYKTYVTNATPERCLLLLRFVSMASRSTGLRANKNTTVRAVVVTFVSCESVRHQLIATLWVYAIIGTYSVKKISTHVWKRGAKWGYLPGQITALPSG